MKFIQITDPHLVPRGKSLHGLNPVERLEACIEDINRNHGDAELCIITGDLAHGGETETYREFRKCIAAIELPVHLLIGNHDRRARVREIFPDLPVDDYGFVQSTIDTSAGRFLLLDTVEEGKAWGSYCEKRLDWLRGALTDAGDQPVYLFMHHTPFQVGMICVDRIGLGADGVRVGEVLSDHDNIRHLFFGHVHRPIAGSWKGIPYTTLRGLSHQVPLDFAPLEVVPKSHEPPAYAIVFLDVDQTTVHIHDYLDTYRVPYDQWTEGRPDWT